MLEFDADVCSNVVTHLITDILSDTSPTAVTRELLSAHAQFGQLVPKNLLKPRPCSAAAQRWTRQRRQRLKIRLPKSGIRSDGNYSVFENLVLLECPHYAAASSFIVEEIRCTTAFDGGTFVTSSNLVDLCSNSKFRECLS